MQPMALDRYALDATVALQTAMERGTRVTVLVRAPDHRGRVVEGVPVDFRVARDGRERVVLHQQEDTFQLLLLERIARVNPYLREM